jgi:hypothetical protein
MGAFHLQLLGLQSAREFLQLGAQQVLFFAHGSCAGMSPVRQA